MKCDIWHAVYDNPASLPVRGAWVEIVSISDKLASLESLPVRGAWVEIVDGSR